ncbi:MAG TPA: OB-fold nucleic acid binding domain-containing protein [Methanotrichaceae archaeon]|nr:OB-fold nucleic acid binding domain-containing protein [Methanotrichaceae archaeon]
MDSELEEIFGQLSDQISEEEFQSRIDEKVSLMGGLCDKRTAAMLVARELGASDVLTKIGRIRPETGTVTFLGRVLSISDVKEFKRSDGSTGRVANITLGDETGTVKAALWDEATELIKSGDIRVDQCLKVRGLAKEGYSGTEISIGRNGGFEEVDQDIRARIEPYKISEIRRDMGEVNLVARVVDPGTPREFLRKDGTKGLVRTVVLGDDTGKIRLTLWNDQARMDLARDDTLEVINGSTKERYGQVEIQTGGYTVVRKSHAQVEFQEKMVPISDLKAGMLCSVSGFVTGLGEVREFQRSDGTPGRVASIYISDQTGRIKVALWGEHVGLIEGLDLGQKAEIIDCQVKNGWNDELEISCGWRTRITFAPPSQVS